MTYEEKVCWLRWYRDSLRWDRESAQEGLPGACVD